MYDQRARVDVVAAEIAARQHGVASVRQLRAAGLDKHGVLHRARTGRLYRVHRGVYGVGHPSLSSEGLWMAAVLACGEVGGGGTSGTGGSGTLVNDIAVRADDGPTWTVLDYWGAALSHCSAAVLWGLLPSREGPVDVSVRGYGGRAKRRGIRLHRSHSLVPVVVTLRSGIPVTTPARTVEDLRRAASPRGKRRLVSSTELRRALRQANVLGLPIGEDALRDRTRSDLERDFLRLCGRHGFPAPEVNVRVGSHLVDFFWRDRMLVVETDGYRYHRGRVAFEDDRARDLDLQSRGFRVVRLSEEQVRADPEQVGAALRRLL